MENGMRKMLIILGVHIHLLMESIQNYEIEKIIKVTLLNSNTWNKKFDHD